MPTIKPCLECTTQNDGDAVTCVACGGGSWPAEVAVVPQTDDPPPGPKAESAPPPPSETNVHSAGSAPSSPAIDASATFDGVPMPTAPIDVAGALVDAAATAPPATIEHPELAETAEQPAAEESAPAPVGVVETDPNEPPNFDGDEPDVTSPPVAAAVEPTSALPKPAVARKRSGK